MRARFHVAFFLFIVIVTHIMVVASFIIMGPEDTFQPPSENFKEEDGVFILLPITPEENEEYIESESIVLDDYPINVDPLAIRKAETASTISILFVVGFLTVLILPLLFLVPSLITVADVVELTTNYSAILSGIIGSVVGYYLKSIEKK